MKFRNETPHRSKVKPLKRYNEYKDNLRIDFGKRCGYCTDNDLFLGARGYQIDHFAPKSKFGLVESERINSYGNLVYSCPFCNRAKSNDWRTESMDQSLDDNGDGYLDPCSDEYESLFKRDEVGRIVPMNRTGQYMYHHLKLYLIRHQIIFLVSKLDEQRNWIKLYIKRNENLSNETTTALNNQLGKIASEMWDCLHYLND